MGSKYEKTRGHKADFKVRYRFWDHSHGGRSQPPGQYYRGDFLYDGDNASEGVWAIHHEFLDDSGEVVDENVVSVPVEGEANMWILSSVGRSEYHVNRISVGVKYYIVEGGAAVGEGIVIEILDLYENCV